MKKIYSVNNSKVVLGLLSGLKSRITSTKPLLTMLALLMVCLFGVNEEAWGYSSSKLTVNISGSGQIKLNTSASQPSSWSSSSLSANQGPHSFGSVWVDDTYYIWVKADDGYRCTGVSECSWNNGGYYTRTITGSTATTKKTSTATFVGNSYTLTFNGNGNTSGSMTNQSFVYGTAKNIKANGFTRAYTVTYQANGGTCSTASETAKYTLAGWAKSANGDVVFTPGQQLKTPTPIPEHGETINLYAVWNAVSVTLPTPTKDGFLFDGWYNGDTYVGKGGASYTPTTGVTLTAHWAEKLTPQFVLDKSQVELEDKAILTLTNVNNPSINISPAGIVAYNAQNGELTALSLGTVTITVTQQAVGDIKYKQEQLSLEVIRKTPSLILYIDGEERTSKSVVQGRKAEITYDKVSDANVVVTNVRGGSYAAYANGEITASEIGTAVFRATLPQTNTYQSTYVEFSIKVTEDLSHLPITINSSDVYDAVNEQAKGSGDRGWDNSNGIYLGKTDSWSTGNWDDKYVTIHFVGVPDKLSFKYKYVYRSENFKTTAVSPLDEVDPNQRYYLYIEESANGSDWTPLAWQNTAPTTTEQSSGDQQLKKTTRYLRFHLHANYGAYYREIKVTELKYVQDPDPAPIDLGTAVINSGEVSKTTLVNWCNVAPLAVTSSNPRFTVSPTSFGGYEDYGSQILTISYTHGSAVGPQEADITLSNGNATFDKTIHVTAETTKRPQTITWNNTLVSTGYAMNVGEQYPDASIAAVATVARGARVTYTSANSNIIEVVADTALLAKGVGKVKIAAHQAGDGEYAAVSDTVEFQVTNLLKQSITWDQDLMSLLTTSGTVELNATASSNGKITYTSGNSDVVSVSGNTLTVVGEGETTITATQAGGEIGGQTYLPISLTASVYVRNPASQCNGKALNVNSLTLSSSHLTQEYTLSGVPETLTFSAYHGTKSGQWGTAPSYASLIVEQYACINDLWDWYEVYNHVVGTSATASGNVSIDASATKIRFCTGETAVDHTISGILVSIKKFMSADVESVDLNVEANSIWQKTITVSHSNIDKMSVTTKQGLLTLSSSTLGDGCGDFGDDAFEVSYTPTNKNTEYKDTIVITDGKTVPSTIEIPVRLYAQALNQMIEGFDLPTSAKTTDLINLTATATSGLAVTYSTSNDQIAQIINNNQLIFVAAGEVTVTASQIGGGAYNAAPNVEQTIVAAAVSPALTTYPTAKAITYRSTLENSTWTEAGVAKVTLRGVPNTVVAGSFSWNDPKHVVMDAAGEHSYKATFTPSDGGMYNNVEYDQTITILRTAQTLEMNNGAVKIAVDGIDAGKADSKIDLDDLIKSQTSDIVNNNERTGAVTYEVISENKANADIAAGNIFSARVIGDYRIRATKAQTDWYKEVTDEFTVTVSKRANTMVISGTSFERFVDQEVTNVRDVQNSDAEVQTSSDFPTIAYYDVANNKIVIPNSESDYQMFGAYKTVTIKIWQEATDRFEACEKTITLVVKKYVTASNGENYELKVNETKTANYGFTNTSASYPSNNPEDDFYYTIDKPNFGNEALNNGTELITYNPETNEITGHNAGTTKITFFQKETYKYTGATLMCNIAVEKRSNQISNSWSNVWQKAMSENGTANISFTSTHGDYANYPISIEQIYGADVATLTGDATNATITTNTTKGYAIWHLSQAENYEYYAADADVMVMVGVPAPPTCYVYEDMNNEHKFSTSITDAEGHFETPIAINSPIDKIWFKAKRQVAGFNYFAVQYSTDDGKTWGTVISPDLGTDYADYSASFPAISGNKRITHVRFGAKTGATLSKWYKDVRISRKAYLTIQDAEQKKISKLPTMTCTIDETSTAEAKFYIDYSTCADEITIESSNLEHFTVSRATINVSDKHDNLTSAKEEITVTYSSTELGTHNAVITVRTSYQTCALSVSGETTKRTPTLTWREGYESNPLTLPVGLTVDAIAPAATTTSTASVMYESDNVNVVKIINDGYAFKVVGVGTATLTAVVPENEKWKSVSDTRVINATAKVVQEIVWNQTFPRFMEPGNVIDLDAQVFLRNLSTSTLEYSEERSQLITYSCPLNNNIVTINGNKMTIQNYGEVKITASVSGDADYEASTMTILITVRQPSAGCETPLVLNKEDAIDMYEWNVDFSNYLNLTTEEMISDEIVIDPMQGKPDKLSFRYEGEEFSIAGMKFFGGVIKFEQRVNSQWVSVEGSRVETVKNEWNARNNLQLDEQADALRIIREQGATGHHYIKDIQVTRKQYLRATKEMIDLGEVTLGQATPVTIGFEYSDIKGDLTARTINNTTDVTIKDNGAIDLECGSFGHYDLPITFTPTQLDDWQGEVEIYDNIANLSIAVKLTATVVANEEYIFNHDGNWNTATNWTTNLVPDENTDITVVKNMTINSAANVKSITIMEGATVTVKSGVTLVVGSGAPKNLPAYGNLHVEEGAQVLLDEEASLPLNDLILDAKLGTTDQHRTIASNSGQITNESKLIVNGDAYFRLAVDPSGHNTYGWYDFTVPFEVDVIGGISIAEDPSAVMKFNVNYAVMDYSEAKRAVNGKYWNKFSGTMQPGHIYTITLDDEMPWNTVVFKKKAGASATGDRSYTTEYSGLGTNNKDNGWNGFGNGTLHHTELDIPAETLIQVYDHANKCYHTREAKDYSIAVGMTFVMQVPSVQTITLLTATSNSRFLAPARESSETDKFRLSLQAEGAENASDYLWVSASEDAAGDYIIGRDVMKMGTMSASNVARIWSVRNSLNLCSNEMPMVNGEASCPLNIYAPVAGSYTLAIDKAPEDANLYLTYNGSVIWDLTASPYSLDLTKGTTTGYGLQLEVVNAPQITTGVDEIGGEKEGNRKVIINDAMYIITKEGAIFNATGKKVK